MTKSPYKTYQNKNDEHDDIYDELKRNNHILYNQIIVLEFERELMFNFILACELEGELERFKEGYLIGLKRYSN